MLLQTYKETYKMGSGQSRNSEIKIRQRSGSDFHPSGNQIYKAARRIKLNEKIKKILSEEDEFKQIMERRRLHDDEGCLDCLQVVEYRVEHGVPVIKASLSN